MCLFIGIIFKDLKKHNKMSTHFLMTLPGSQHMPVTDALFRTSDLNNYKLAQKRHQNEHEDYSTKPSKI